MITACDYYNRGLFKPFPWIAFINPFSRFIVGYYNKMIWLVIQADGAILAASSTFSILSFSTSLESKFLTEYLLAASSKNDMALPPSSGYSIFFTHVYLRNILYDFCRIFQLDIYDMFSGKFSA